jgi:hypothetical protein
MEAGQHLRAKLFDDWQGPQSLDPLLADRPPLNRRDREINKDWTHRADKRNALVYRVRTAKIFCGWAWLNWIALCHFAKPVFSAGEVTPAAVADHTVPHKSD